MSNDSNRQNIGTMTLDEIEDARSACRLRMAELEREIVAVRARIGRAKSDAYTMRRYLPPAEFRALEDQAAKLGQEKAGEQYKLAEMNREVRARGRAAEAAKERGGEQKVIGHDLLSDILDNLDFIVDHLVHSCQKCHANDA